MSQSAAELTVQDLRDMRRSFSRQELLNLIDRMFTDEHTALDMDVVDAAIFRLPVLIQSLDPARRRVALTLQELLGTWEENAARFRPGQSVPGVVCGKTDYGVFIALTPNLCGLAERDDTLEPGQPVCVYIKAIHPETLKLKLTVLHRLDALPPQPLPFTKTQGRLDVWRYGSREHAKNVTVF